jgi:acetoin utilization protein AcuB
MMQMLHVMTKHPETIGPDDLLSKAKEMMDAGNFRRLPVIQEGRVIGILTERDIREHSGYLKSTKVDAAMKSPVVSVKSKASVEDAARLMLAHKIGGMPVVDNDKLVGVVTSTDMLRAFLNVIEATQKITEH